MLKMINKCKYNGNATDLYFSNGCDKFKLNIPSVRDSLYFGFENVYKQDITPIGVHKPWIHILNENYKDLKKNALL